MDRKGGARRTDLALKMSRGERVRERDLETRKRRGGGAIIFFFVDLPAGGYKRRHIMKDKTSVGGQRTQRPTIKHSTGSGLSVW